MVPYNTPQTIRPLEKMVCDFAYSNGYDPISVFNDFLRYVIHGFSPGAPPLMDWKYKRQQNRHFMEMLTRWIRLMQRELQSGGWFDAFGDLFMAISSKSGRQVNGQFFTPPDICDLMVLCIIRKSKFPQNPKRSVRFSGKRTKRSVQKRKARNTQKAETKVL